MANSIQNEIDSLKTKLAELEGFAKIQGELVALPAKHGFSDMDSFIKALKGAVNPSAVVTEKKDSKEPKKVKARKGKGGKRARITPEIKAQVKAALVAGKTGAEVSKQFGISVPSVQNIKKEFGMVKKRA